MEIIVESIGHPLTAARFTGMLLCASAILLYLLAVGLLLHLKSVTKTTRWVSFAVPAATGTIALLCGLLALALPTPTHLLISEKFAAEHGVEGLRPNWGRIESCYEGSGNAAAAYTWVDDEGNKVDAILVKYAEQDGLCDYELTEKA